MIFRNYLATFFFLLTPAFLLAQEISTAEQLNNIRQNLDGDYFLTSNIDLSDFSADEGWLPIGTEAAPFTGSFDGGGFKITNLRINRPTTNDVGLFGRVGNTTIGDFAISNLYIEDAEVVGQDSTGIVAGYVENRGVSAVYTTGSVTGSGRVGGVVGELVGPISNSGTRASVSATNTFGGLVGAMRFGNATNCYAASVISADGEGLIGGLLSGRTFTSYWDSEVSGATTSVHGTPRTTAEMTCEGYLAAGTYADWSIGLAWIISSSNDGYPIPVSLANQFPVMISTLSDLEEIGASNCMPLNARYALANSIDASETSEDDYREFTGWIPIGGYEGNEFRGTFDGRGHTISNLHINRAGDNLGLFAKLGFGSNVSNLTLRDFEIEGFNQVGALAGQASGANISSCIIVGNVTGFDNLGSLVGLSRSMSIISNVKSDGNVSGNKGVGGLIGRGVQTQLIQSLSTSDVRSTDLNVGGLIGELKQGQLDQCYASGSVRGNGVVGGLVGIVSGLTDIRDSYARGGVSTRHSSTNLLGNTAGGLVGSLNATSTITNCYSIGFVEGLNNTGGLVGSNAGSSVTSSFWNRQTSAQSSSAGGTGANTAEMTDFNRALFSGWDFEDAWFDEFPSFVTFVNNQYLHHRWISLDFFNLDYFTNGGGYINDEFQVGLIDRGIPGFDGPEILAIPRDGYVFLEWSDGSTDNPRRDLNIFEGSKYEAIFGTVNPFVLDGSISPDACLVGDDLRIQQTNEWIYIAADIPLPDDVFIYLSDDPSVLQTANWNKSGQVGEWDYILAREGGDGSDFAGWFDSDGLSIQTPDPREMVFNRNGTLLEGAIRRDLLSQFENVYIALGVFGTDDAGTLLSQSPSSENGDSNIDINEFYVIENKRDSSCPVPIATAEELDAIRNEPGADYILVGDIDLSGFSDGEGWLPIPNFTGDLDGAGFAIRNLTINRPQVDSVGLFASISNSFIRDLSLIDVSIVGRNGVAGLSGQSASSFIRNVTVTGDIADSDSFLGGLIGLGNDSNFDTNSFVGSIEGNSSVGGIAGRLIGGEIVRSYVVSRSISGNFLVGGILGNSADASVRESYFAGNLAGGDSVGGILGGGSIQIQNSLLQVVEDCYTTGQVTGTTSVGGIIGSLATSDGITSGGDSWYTTTLITGDSETDPFIGKHSGEGTDSQPTFPFDLQEGYWDREATGQNTSAYGEGRTTEEMTLPYDENTFVGWSTFVWDLVDADLPNNGYPFHTWQTVRHNLVYTAGAGGSIQGAATQVRIPGADGSMVEAVADPGATFLGWSDGVMEPIRTDQLIIGDLNVTALFRAGNPFPMDGTIPTEACELAGGLFVAEQDGWIYVASNIPAPDGEDVFIYLSADPSQLQPANWAKAGQVGAWGFMLAREGTNDFAGWFDSDELFIDESLNPDVISNRNENLVEGAIRKEAITAGGPVFVALGVFATNDGEGLLRQAPPSTPMDGTIEGSEFFPLTGLENPCQPNDEYLIR